MRQNVSSNSPYEPLVGFSRAVRVGNQVFVSGTAPWGSDGRIIEGSVYEQAKQCIANIAAALTEAGAEFADVVRVRYLLPDRDDFEPCWPVLRECFGEVRPAATMQVCGLADPRMRIEIEVTARRSGSSRTAE